MGGGQPASGLHPNAEYLFHLELSAALDAVFQGDANEIFHDQEWYIRYVMNGMDCHHMLVSHRGRGSGFSKKSGPRSSLGCQLRVEHLDGHEPFQLGVAGFEHNSHSPASDDLQYLVLAQLALVARILGRLEKAQGGRDCS